MKRNRSLFINGCNSETVRHGEFFSTVFFKFPSDPKDPLLDHDPSLFGTHLWMEEEDPTPVRSWQQNMDALEAISASIESAKSAQVERKEISLNLPPPVEQDGEAPRFLYDTDGDYYFPELMERTEKYVLPHNHPKN
jgi:hypothetical protein